MLHINSASRSANVSVMNCTDRNKLEIY